MRFSRAFAFTVTVTLGPALASCVDPAPAPDAPRFAAVGAGGTIATSGDGARWTAEESPTSADLTAVTFGHETLVAVGSGGTIVSSLDGVGWTVRNSGGTDLTDVIFTGEHFLAVGGDWATGAAALVSPDGVSWETLAAPEDHMFHAAASIDGTLLAAAWYRSDLQTPSLFVTEMAGSGWTPRSGPDFHDSVTIAGEVLAVGDRSVHRSSDGEIWDSLELPGQQYVAAIGHGGGRFVVVGSAIYSSPDGRSWTENESPEPGWLSGVAHGGGRFVAVGSGGLILSSPDGTDWNRRSVPLAAEADLRDVSYAAWGDDG
jgi:hypothetical protein